MNESPRPATPPPVETGLVYAHGLAAIITLLISVTFGVLASIELLAPDFGPGPGQGPGWGRRRVRGWWAPAGRAGGAVSAVGILEGGGGMRTGAP